MTEARHAAPRRTRAARPRPLQPAGPAPDRTGAGRDRAAALLALDERALAGPERWVYAVGAGLVLCCVGVTVMLSAALLDGVGALLRVVLTAAGLWAVTIGGLGVHSGVRLRAEGERTG